MASKINEHINPYIYQDIQMITAANLPWENFRNKTVLITGAAGFIGYYLIAALLELNDQKNLNICVIGLVRNKERAEKKFGAILQRNDFELMVQDICSPIATGKKADYIIHAASQASNIQFETDPVGTISANLSGTINVLEYARTIGTISTLFISSLKVYGVVNDGSSCLTEETVGYIDHTSYKNCYAQGKRAAETLCASYVKEYGMDIKIARPSYIYGASSLNDDRVWAQLMANVVRHENIVLKSNGAAYRSFCYVADTVSALFTILLKGETGQPYNIADERSNVTIRNLAKITAEIFPERDLHRIFVNPEDEKEPLINYSATPEILDSEKLHALGWKAQFDLKSGIRRSVFILESRKES